METAVETAKSTAVQDLVPGDVLDLEGDDYADPWPHDNLDLTFEYATVEAVVLESHTVLVHTANAGSYGFPYGWMVAVVDHCADYDED